MTPERLAELRRYSLTDARTKEYKAGRMFLARAAEGVKLRRALHNRGYVTENAVIWGSSTPHIDVTEMMSSGKLRMAHHCHRRTNPRGGAKPVIKVESRWPRTITCDGCGARTNTNIQFGTERQPIVVDLCPRCIHQTIILLQSTQEAKP